MKGTNLAPSLVSRLRENTAAPGGLHHLDISNTLAGPRELSAIGDCIKANLPSCDGMAPLISIDLSGNQICGIDFLLTGSLDSTGLSDLFTILSNVGKMSRLRRINLSRNFLGEEGFSVLSVFLSSGPSSLTDLDVRNCGGNDKALQKLFAGVKNSKSLTSLDARQNKAGAAACKVLGDVLSSNSKLKQLMLNDCSIGREGTAAIMKGLQNNQTLEILAFGDNRIGDGGAECVAEMLRVNQKIRHLDLQENEISNSGAAAISQALAQNRCLVFLGLQWNLIDNQGAFVLSEGISRNGGALRSLHIVGTRIDMAGIASIIESSLKGPAADSSSTDGEKKEEGRNSPAPAAAAAAAPAQGAASNRAIEVDLGFAYYNLIQLQS